MHRQNTTNQRTRVIQRVLVLFCVCMLFVFVGIVFSITSAIYAQGAVHNRSVDKPFDLGTPPVTVVPTDVPTTPPTPMPTTPPTPMPTTPPTPMPTTPPTPVPTTPPTPVPTNPPTTQPTVPPVSNPTSAAGVPPVPPSGPVDPRQQPTFPTPSPSSSPTKTTPTPTRGASTATPNATVSGSSSAVIPTTASISTPDTNKTMPMMQSGLLTGTAVLLGGTALMGVMWRQKRMRLALQTNKRPPIQPVQTQLAMPQAYTAPATSFALANGMQRDPAPLQSSPAPVSTQNIEEIWEHSPIFQEARLSKGMMPVPETPRLAQETVSTLDPLLENLMRQAQAGLFVLPDK